MGKSSTANQLAGKIQRAGHAITSNRQAMEQTALATKGLFVAEAARSGVGRGVGRSPVSSKVGVRYDLTGTEPSKATVRYTGPAHLVNNPTQAHLITPRAFVGTRGKGAKAQKAAGLLAAFGLDARTGGLGGGAAVVAGHPVRVVHHPGTRGLHFFQRAKRRTVQVAPDVYKRAGLTIPLREVFK